jgi:glutamate racemase
MNLTAKASSTAPIGVFDSGIGGLSILKALRLEMPHERFVYFADSAHNPYGDKSDAFVIDRSRAIAQLLIQNHGIKALVVACNTATAAAIHILRAEHPGLPIIGVEPALKPAVAISRTQRIAVLATRGTLQSAKFHALLQSLAGQAEFVCTPCDGLADLIERGPSAAAPGSATDFSEIYTTNLIAACATFIRASGIFGTQSGQLDTLVLGCTHYPLVLPAFRQAVGAAVHIVDNGQAVAKRVAALITPTPAAAAATVTTAPSAAQSTLPSTAALDQLQLLSSAAQQPLLNAAARWL